VRGHRTYSDPNLRLVSARETVWIAPVLRGHRSFTGPEVWANASHRAFAATPSSPVSRSRPSRLQSTFAGLRNG
jgi:hypothetical protein